MISEAAMIASRIGVPRNQRVGAQKRLQAKPTGTDEAALFTDDAFRDLIALCQDLSGLFYAATTAHRDRKEAIRTMVERVLVTERTAETVSLRIHWADGSEATPIEVRLMRYAHRLIAELAEQGLGNVEIARRLNALGLETSRGRAWSPATVWQVRNYRAVKGQQDQRTMCGPSKRRATV